MTDHFRIYYEVQGGYALHDTTPDLVTAVTTLRDLHNHRDGYTTNDTLLISRHDGQIYLESGQPNPNEFADLVAEGVKYGDQFRVGNAPLVMGVRVSVHGEHVILADVDNTVRKVATTLAFAGGPGRPDSGWWNHIATAREVINIVRG